MSDATTPSGTPEKSLQEVHGPAGRCFGCGPANPKGLRIRSLPLDENDPDGEIVADWTPEPHHEAFEGALNGGIIGALLDCHSNWTAAWHLWKKGAAGAEFPSTVTAEFTVRMKRPTPSKGPVRLSARAVASEGNKVTVESTLSAGGKVTATCMGIFVAVPPGHPAYHRWN